jgi:hypothetical protein
MRRGTAGKSSQAEGSIPSKPVPSTKRQLCYLAPWARGRTGRALSRRRLDRPKKPIVNPHSPSRSEIVIVLELVLGFIPDFTPPGTLSKSTVTENRRSKSFDKMAASRRLEQRIRFRTIDRLIPLELEPVPN